MIRTALALLSLALVASGALDAAGILDAPDFVTALGAAGGLAMSCGGLGGTMANGASACAPDPGAREWVLADRIDASRLTLGSQVQVKLNQVPAKDSLGRFAHIRGIKFVTRAGFTITDVTNTAVSGFDIRAAYQSLHMEDLTGHVFFDAIDGRTILDDQYFRHYALQQFPPIHGGANQGGAEGYIEPQDDYGVAANVGAASTVYKDGGLYIPLTSNSDWANPAEGLVPLAAIAGAGPSALRFNVAQSIPGTNTNISFAGFFLPDSNVGGMEVWLDIVYLDALVVDAPWTIDCYTIAEQSGTLRYADRATEYAWYRYRREDPSGVTSPGSLDGFTLTVAGFTKYAALSLAQMTRRMAAYIRCVPDSDIAEGNTTAALPVVDGGVRALPLLPMRQRATAPAGAIQYTVATDPLSFLRFVHRTVKCNTTARRDAIVAAAQCNPCRYEQTQGGNLAPVVVHEKK